MDTQAILAARKHESQPASRPPHLWPAIFLVLVLVGVAVAFLGSPGPEKTITSPGTSPDSVRDSRVYTVRYRFGVFSPTNLRIHEGDTVHWKNDSPLPVRVVSQLLPGEKLPAFDSAGNIQPGGYFSNTFPLNGIFGYYNPSDVNESGVIIVRE